MIYLTIKIMDLVLLCNHCRYYFEERFKIIKLPYDVLPRRNYGLRFLVPLETQNIT